MWSGFLGALLGGGGDRIPAALDWTIAASALVGATEATNSQTISGINRPITLRITASATSTMEYRKNGGAWTGIASGGQVSVVLNDTIEWRASRALVGTATFSVYNDSAGGTLLDTFACNWFVV